MSRVRLIAFCLLLFPVWVFAQTTRVQGRVTHAPDGKGLPFVAVYFEGTTIGVYTDETGAYAIETEGNDSHYTLTASVAGFAPQSVQVAGGTDSKVDFALSLDASGDPEYLLDNVRVRSILYNLQKNRHRNDPLQKDAWQAGIYSKVELAVANVDNMVGKFIFRKRSDLIPEFRDSTAFNGYIPVLLSEAVLKRFHAVEPVVDKEVFEASRISGLDQQNIVRQFTGSSTLRMDFYRDIIPVFNQSFPSPASSVGHIYYNYAFVDSLCISGRKTFTVSFFPKKLITAPVLEGLMEIDAEDYALRAVHARLSPASNINWIRSINVDSEYARREDGTWFYDQEQLFLDMSAHLNDNVTVVSFQMNRDLRYTSVEYGSFPGMAEKSGGDKIEVDENPERDPAWWDSVRPSALTSREEAIFTTAERFKQKRSFQWLYAIGNMFVTGFLENRNLGISYGPWERTVTFNATEGVRVQGGLRTTKELSRKMRLTATLSYGFGDQEWKWFTGGEFMLGDNQKRTNKITFRAGHDYENLGRGSGVFTERNIINSLLAPGGFDKRGLMSQVQLEHKYEFSPNVNSTFSIHHLRVFANGDIPLIRPDGTAAGSFSANQVHWIGRFSWEERIDRGIFDKTYLFTRFPIVSVDLLGGIKGITADDCSFLRGELTVDWRIPAGLVGFGNVHLNGGAIIGSVPYPLLKLHEGNQSQLFDSPVVGLLDRSAFSLMNYYEFASDRWITGYYEHNFNGLLLGIVPLVNRLGLREVVTVRGAWGSLSDWNRYQAPFRLPEGCLNSLEKPYVEAGVGIANIFHLLRVDCVWKLTHRTGRDFAVNVGLDLDF